MNRALSTAAVVIAAPIALGLTMACHTPSHHGAPPAHHHPALSVSAHSSTVTSPSGGHPSTPAKTPCKTTPVTSSVAVSSPSSPAEVPPPPTPTTSAPAKGSTRPVHPVISSSLVLASPVHVTGAVGTAFASVRPSGLANTGAQTDQLLEVGGLLVGLGVLTLGAGLKRRGRHT